ncbi:nodulation receptor kinase-like isoform X2 [Nicotiana tomentosiformis]|uniref:nodulation receptor kinase-like isoform X2 n=1 Tax=Nicotiana tomentosiformis TaxID=4098 RepID=UPI00051BA78E|nr:nodulation receptor kinase-like isoform X2 [Nicotiana tomentosiformis]
MMEVVNCWNTRLVNCGIIFLLLFVQSAFAQVFLSIQCCAPANFTEPSTNLSWISDETWFPENQSCIIRTAHKNTPYERARFFSSDIGRKWCYNLPTRIDQDYLVRGTFLSGNQEKAIPHSSFVVLIGVTPLATVKSSDELRVEGIFRATRNYTNFCLLNKKGKPYLSKVELRPINPDYLKREPSEVLKLVHRVDSGNKGAEIRYPYDQYDRIWRPASNLDSEVAHIQPSIVKQANAEAHRLLPPSLVLQTALTHPGRLEFLHEDLDTGYYTYYLVLYFFEPNDSVQAGERVFHVYINNEKRLEVDILASGSRYLDVVLKFRANRAVNLTMIKASNLSQLGPICNAYEILKTLPRVKETAIEEVDIMVNMKMELLQHNQNNEILRSWSGDPCLPLPWRGLTCDRVNGTSVITQMNLSLGGLSGPSPPSIQKLMHLRKLDMSNDGSSGTITLFPSSSTFSARNFSRSLHLSNKLSKSIKESNSTTVKGMANGKQNTSSAHKLVIGAAVGASLLVILAIVISIVCLYKRRVIAGPRFSMRSYSVTKNAVYSVPSTDTTLKSISIRNFTLEYIEAVTQNYKTLIGEGGFGSVYRGTLTDGEEVAVKVRSATSTQGTREFNNELTLLSAITHENLIPLLGYCCENDQQILVYPFMSNGSLQDRLYGAAAKRKTLDWPARLSIALGAARGLMYLHTFSERCLIHRDVKSSNILLDQSMCAKVADFGFSKYASQEGDSGTSLEVRGTAGYLDPEYYSTQHLSAKSDVFSFGVVLLEILTGREPLNISRPRNEWSLVEWAKPLIRNSRVEEIVDPAIKGGYHGEALWRVVEVALACTETYSTYRPCMADIIRELEDALIIENNASEYLKSLDSFGGSNRFSIERSIILPPIKSQIEPSSLLSNPAPPQPR